MRDRRKIWLRIVLWALVVFWMGVIFSLSAQVQEDSAETSGRVIRWLLTHFDRSFSSLSAEEQLLRMEGLSFLVRKSAHFCLFAVMGFLAFAAFRVDLPPRKAYSAALLLGLGRGVLDEVQQAFVSGRSCEFRDMCIDFAGVILGAAFLLMILSLIQRKKLKK